MTEREIVVAPLGLVTKPNKVGQYPAGALLTAQNVCMRAPGIVEPLPARSQYAANGGGADAVMRLWPRASSLLVLSTGALYAVTDSTRTAITLPTGWATSASYSRFMRAKQRDFLTATGGPVSITGTTATAVGLAPPASINCTSRTTATTDQALANNTNANYRVIFTRQTATGLISSAPSNILNVDNSSGSTAAPDIRARLLTASNHQVGDVMEVYRTASQATGTDPGNRFRLCGSHTMDAGDIAALSVTVTDNCTDASLGADLYSNPGQPTQSARHNRCPSIATDMAAFKGYSFYATPYSHVRGKFKILGRVGFLALTGSIRTHGIGTRSTQGDFASGTATILNVGASNLVGLSVGQSLGNSANIPAGTTITNIAGTTITMSQNAIGTELSGVFHVYDVLEIQGVKYDFPNLEDLADAIALDDTGLILRTDAYLRQSLTVSGVGNVGFDANATILFEDVFYASHGDTPLTFRATNGSNYSPTLEGFTGAVYTHTLSPNHARLTVSKLDQPDHVPEENELVIGSGYIHRLIPTTDALFVFCSDGLYAIEGDGGVFRVRVVDSTLRLATRSSVDVMSDLLWAYTNRGFVSIGRGGVERELSTLTIGDLIPGDAITSESADAAINQLRTFVTCDERNREARLCIRDSSTSTIYLYNVATEKLSTIVDSTSGNEVVAECYAPYLESIVWSVSVTGASTPLYTYTATSSTRSDAVIEYQHIYGDKQPFTLKQWSDFEFLFRNVGGALTIDMKVNGADAFDAVAGTLHNGVRHYIAGMPLDHAMAPSASFGFVTNVAGGSGWQLVGLGARWVPISKQVHK